MKETLDPYDEEKKFFDEVESNEVGDAEKSDLMKQLQKFMDDEKDDEYEKHVAEISVEKRLERLQTNYGGGPTTREMNRRNRENVANCRLESSFTVSSKTNVPVQQRPW